MALSPLALTTVAAVRGQLHLPALATPGTPAVSVVGTAGSTTYSYRVLAFDATMTTAPGGTGTASTGNATLNATNFTRVVWAAVAGATGYLVYRTVGGATQGLIATMTDETVLTMDDTGLTGDGAPLPGAADQSMIEGLIDAVSSMFEEHCGRILASRAFTAEPQDGNGRSNLYLRGDSKPAYPVSPPLTALSLLSTDLRQTLVIDPTPSTNQMRLEPATGRVTLYIGALPLLGFQLQTGGLLFPLGRNNVLATFTAGFSLSAHPADRAALARLTLIGVQWLLASTARDPSINRVDVRGDGGMGVTYGGSGGSSRLAGTTLPDVLQVGLAPYVCQRLL
jgi:hypothetical protein